MSAAPSVTTTGPPFPARDAPALAGVKGKRPPLHFGPFRNGALASLVAVTLGLPS